MKITVKHYGQPIREFQLRKCPFCRGDNLKLCCVNYAPLLYQVVCQDCGGRTNPQRTEEDAISVWNGDLYGIFKRATADRQDS